MKTLKSIVLLATLVSLTGATYAQSPSPEASPEVQHAATTVAGLHDGMLDPASFVLDGVYITKPIKNKRFHGAFYYCYAFRSHNRMGGYSDSRAAEEALPAGADASAMPWGTKGEVGKVEIYNESTNSSGFPGYDIGWGAPCTTKNIVQDITKDVAALAPSLYKKTK